MKYEKLMEKALELETQKGTEWAEAHSDLWDEFDETINSEYDAGNLDNAQFNLLALIAFYDYPNLKDED